VLPFLSLLFSKRLQAIAVKKSPKVEKEFWRCRAEYIDNMMAHESKQILHELNAQTKKYRTAPAPTYETV
jgi:hypothetical protein